jgi:hypothetical protein
MIEIDPASRFRPLRSGRGPPIILRPPSRLLNAAGASGWARDACFTNGIHTSLGRTAMNTVLARAPAVHYHTCHDSTTTGALLAHISAVLLVLVIAVLLLQGINVIIRNRGDDLASRREAMVSVCTACAVILIILRAVPCA